MTFINKDLVAKIQFMSEIFSFSKKIFPIYLILEIIPEIWKITALLY